MKVNNCWVNEEKEEYLSEYVKKDTMQLKWISEKYGFIAYMKRDWIQYEQSQQVFGCEMLTVY